MFVVLIYKYAGATAIDRIVGGFANTEESADWCSHNIAQPFDIREVKHYAIDEGADSPTGVA